MDDYQPVCGTLNRRSCSWCDTMNPIYSGRANYCMECHHRSDLARMDCDCPKCKPEDNVAREEAAETLSVERMLAFLDTLRNRNRDR